MSKNNNTSKLLNLIKNKYFITTVIFLVVFLFISENNLFFTLGLKRDVNKLHKMEQEMIEEIAHDSIQALSLRDNLEATERFGREHYYMKRADEDLFVIAEDK